MTQIYTTLKKIRDAKPCEEGWKYLLKHLNKKKADSKPLPLSVILEINGLDDTLWALRSVPEYNNLWRKYAVWCARQVQHLMTDQRSLDALDVAWRHSEGEATDGELAVAQDAAEAAAWYVVGATARAAAWATAGATAGDAVWAAAWATAGDAARAAQTEKLRQIIEAGEWVE